MVDQRVLSSGTDEIGDEHMQELQALTREELQHRIQAYNEQKQVCVDQASEPLEIHYLTQY